MDLFGNMSTNHNLWSILLVIYNLPPGLCMMIKYMMFFMMISNPRQPGNDINVYLCPMIEDLKLMWDQGVEIFNEFSNETMHAMLFCTINDFPAYGNLSEYNVKGYKGCPICEEDIASQQLKHVRKIIYLRH